jgi:anti-anti-sigma regulatory factor
MRATTLQQSDDVPVVVFLESNEMDWWQEEPSLIEAELFPFITAAARPEHLVCDYSQRRFLSSGHLAKMLKLRKLVIGRGGSLHFFGLAPELFETLRTMGLDRFFPFYSSREDAIAAARQMMPEPTADPGILDTVD